MFGRRKREQAQNEAILQLQAVINNLIEENARLTRDLLAKEQRLVYMARELRQIDDVIFSISQCTGWPQMQPRITQLTESMMVRKKAASDQINNLIEDKLRDTYVGGPK